MTRAAFRYLVIGTAVAYCIWIILPWLPQDLTDEELRILSFYGWGSLIDYPPHIWNLVAVLRITAIVGLLLFMHWGRTLYAILVATDLATGITMGIWVSLPLDGYFGHLSALLDGAIIAIAFTQPMAAQFQIGVWPRRKSTTYGAST